MTDRSQEFWQTQVSIRDDEIARLRTNMERLLIKIDWNSDEFHDPKQYNETRNIVLDSLSPLSNPQHRDGFCSKCGSMAECGCEDKAKAGE